MIGGLGGGGVPGNGISPPRRAACLSPFSTSRRDASFGSDGQIGRVGRLLQIAGAFGVKGRVEKTTE